MNLGRLLTEGMTANCICRLINKIFGFTKQRSIRIRAERDNAYKTIRLAGNYCESHKTIAKRIRSESARYTAFKRTPQLIRSVTLNIKQLDSSEYSQHQFEIGPPLKPHDVEGKTSLLYYHERSPNVVLEFVLNDQNHLPLFAIARTYSDWVGYKEFELGAGRVFYIQMDDDDKPGNVAVHAGFKALRSRQRISASKGRHR